MLILETLYNEEEKLWQGAESQSYVEPNISIGEALFQALKENATTKFQISHDDGTSDTNEQVLFKAIRVAQYLKDEGLTHEDVVGVIARNNMNVTYLLFACLFNATPFHTVNPMLEPGAIASIYGITKPKLIFCDGQDYEVIKQSTNDWSPRIFTLNNHIENVPHIDQLLAKSNMENIYETTKLVAGANQTMGIICSSGTTGLPKAVTLTNAQLLLISPITGTEIVVFTAVGFDWISSIKTLLVNTISGATRIVSRQPFSTALFVEIVWKHRVTSCFLSYYQFNELFTGPLAISEKLSSLQFVAYGGGWVSAGVHQLAQKILENVVFLYFYGSSETDVVSVCINPESNNLVGSLVTGKFVRIVNEEGKFLGHNEMGELLVKTDFHWNGYYNNIEQTARILDSKGWFHIGDLGYFDNENKLHVVDRKKDLLKYKSMHYTPNEIEKIIIELPDVQDVCVVGIKDRLYGDAAGALIMRKPGGLLTELQVINYVAKRIPVEFKQLHAGVRFVESMPRNLNGKLLRNVAEEMFEVRQMPKASL